MHWVNKNNNMVPEGKSRKKTDELNGVAMQRAARSIHFLRRSFKSPGSHMPPHSLLLHSRSFRPLRNTFRSIDFAVDTQAVGTERRRSRKSARVKGGETGARLGQGGWGGGEGRRREGGTYRSEGEKKETLPRKRDREIKGLRKLSAEQDRGEREGETEEKGRDEDRRAR